MVFELTVIFVCVRSGDTTQSQQNLGFSHQMSSGLVSPATAMETLPRDEFTEGEMMCFCRAMLLFLSGG